MTDERTTPQAGSKAARLGRRGVLGGLIGAVVAIGLSWAISGIGGTAHDVAFFVLWLLLVGAIIAIAVGAVALLVSAAQRRP